METAKKSTAPNKFTSKTTKNYYAMISCNVSNVFGLSNLSEVVVKKISLGLDTSTATGTDESPAKFLKEGTEVLALPLSYQ